MSKRKTGAASKTLDRMRAAAQGRTTAAMTPPAPVDSEQPEQVEKPKQRKPAMSRYTIDLTHEDRKFMIHWATDNEIDRSDAFRAFISLLRDRPDMTDLVRDRHDQLKQSST
jgi:non-canonical (house-cleaning) NTP pyrophosphatase